MSTYSPSLRIELITTGTQAGTWGNTTNTNLGGLIESAIAGYTSVSITSANQALTALNGAPDESRNQIIALTTTTAAAFAVYAPPAEKTYVIYNASAYAATIYNSSVLGNTTPAPGGTSVTIPAGKTMTIWSDGTSFAFQNTHLIGTVVGNVTGNLTGNVTGNVTGNTNGVVTGTAGSSLIGNVTGNVSGTAANVTGTVAVANGGTGATSFTSGALLKGAGTGAVAPASAADIVGQIGSTAVQNATTAANGGVTSVNGSTGAVTVSIVPSAFDAVGTTLLALNISTSDLLPGNTIAGSNLAYVSGVQSWSSVITIFSGSVIVTTLASTPKSLLGGVGQSGNGNPGWQSMPNTTTLPGTWRVLFLSPARQYVFDSNYNQYFQQAYFTLVQRIS